MILERYDFKIIFLNGLANACTEDIKMKENKAEQTRKRIVQAAFEEIYCHGYQGMRIDAVLDKTGLAKGALYHHFPNKKTLGYAVIDEIIFEHMKESIDTSMNVFDHSIDAICNALCMDDNITEEQVTLGCPLNNLAQEMAGLDKGFKDRLSRIYNFWTNTIADSLREGKRQGHVKSDVNEEATALFLISALQGIIGSAKCMQSKAALRQMSDTLRLYIQSLKA